MCECGCEMNSRRYIFPAPNRAIYLLTLQTPCINCVAPPGIMIEVINPEHTLYREYKRGDFNALPLPFQEWSDGRGISISTGLEREEFIKACSKHLIGIGSSMFGSNGSIDADGAEVILEEMYEDSQIRPTINEPVQP